MVTLDEMKARLWHASLRLWMWRWQTLPIEDRAVFYKQPENRPVYKRRSRAYGLSEYDANILIDAGPEVTEYFEVFVEIVEYLSERVEHPVETNGYNLGQASAKFIINELFSVAKRHKVNLTDIPIHSAACMLIDRRRRLINNKQIKEQFDRMFVRN